MTLVGMMGTGKSHIGRRLAEMLRVPFRDSDRLVEHKAGMSIDEIFEKFGEPKFREAEKNAILELLGGGVNVIATGGGCVMNADAMQAIGEKSVSIWIKSDAANIARRLKSGKNRPLLQNGDPETILRELMEKREPFYAKANIAVESVEGSVEQTLNAALRELRGFLKQDTL